MRALRTPAELFQVVEAETPLGGRARTLEPLGRLWLAVERAHRSGSSGGEEPPVDRLKILAQSRVDARVAAGICVWVDGADWRLTHVVRDAPKMGRMTLTLERQDG